MAPTPLCTWLSDLFRRGPQSLDANTADATESKQRGADGVETPKKKPVASLLDEMRDGREYESLVNCAPTNLDLIGEFRRALRAIEEIRNRPALLYAGNLLTPVPNPHIGIGPHDELPFAEMVDAVPPEHRSVDVIVLTPGGSAQTASYFVDKLRNRFDHVAFLIPYVCMSAGTIWVLSGDEIWMDERSYLGPIDPQVPGRDGRFVPLLAIWVLVKEIQERGQKAIASGSQPDWSHLQLLRNLDPKELGDALSAGGYSTNLAAAYLERWKFRNWVTHSSTGAPVTPDERKQRAEQIAKELCNHELWKMHSHRLPRDVVETQLRLKVERCESVPGMSRSMRRLWALMYYIFENTHLVKLILSQHYGLFRQRVEVSK